MKPKELTTLPLDVTPTPFLSISISPLTLVTDVNPTNQASNVPSDSPLGTLLLGNHLITDAFATGYLKMRQSKVTSGDKVWTQIFTHTRCKRKKANRYHAIQEEPNEDR